MDQVKCYTTWDAAYLYLGFKVDDPDVTATHRAPNADVSGDDLIEVYIDSSNSGSEKVTPKCFSMAVTAAGGSQCRAGTEAGTFDSVPIYTFKYGATVQGTINNSDDIDMGFTVEIAIPWSVLKRSVPQMGDQMGLNIIIRRAGDKTGSLVSLSPRVKTEEDALNPSKWVKIVFAAHSFGVATTSVEKILSAKYVVRSPLVEGIVGDKEWHQNTSFSIALPMPEGFVYEAKFPPQRTVFAVYDYEYYSDTRRAQSSTPNARWLHAGLIDHPVKHAGPWFSYDRVQFHKDQLSDMVAAGVDVVLPLYRGDKAARSTHARRGLDCMVAAAAEMKDEGKPYPLIGMLFDTTGLIHANGGKAPSLVDTGVQRSFYGMVKDFYERVPVEFRALAQAGKPRAGQAGDVVFLNKADSFSGLDNSFIAFCNEAYERDFGRPLVWIVSQDFRGKIDGYDGVASLDASQPGGVNTGPRISVAAVSAGMDTTAMPGSPMIRSREGGDAYESDWANVTKANPHWVVCNSWTGFHDGTDLGSSREYDRKYVDATRSNVDRFLGNRDLDAQFLSFSVPKVIPPKTFAQAEVVIRNMGNLPWRVSDGYALAYRWYRSGRYYGESKVRRPLERDVLPGGTVAITIGIATVNAQGNEMPEGDCELRFELVRLSDGKWFSAIGDQPLLVPVTVGKTPEWDASWVSCDAPIMMAAGKPYPVSIRVRNGGSTIWKKGAVKLGCKLFKVANFTLDSPADLNEEIPVKPISLTLDKECKPGEIAEFAADIELARADKKPLDPWKPEDDWSYQLRFDITNGQSGSQTRPLKRVIEIIENDYGPRLVDCDIPTKLIAGQTYDVKVIVRNMGTQAWDRKRTKLGYHWYYVDGTEMDWDGQSVPLKMDLTPGFPAVVLAQVKAPEYDGQYILVWDVMIDGKWLSLEPQSSGGDVLPVFLEVTGGKLAFVDVPALCDISAASPDAERNTGDFDGFGSSFPAEFFPPDTGPGQEPSRIYPSGYAFYRGAVPAGRISFLYPEKTPGAKSALACRGQRIDVEDATYVALHVLGASIDGTQTGAVSLTYPDESKMATLRMYDWGGGDAGSDVKMGLSARHRHTHGGDDLGKPCILHHYSIPVDATKALTEIKLPDNPAMRIVAITLERTAVPPPAAE